MVHSIGLKKSPGEKAYIKNSKEHPPIPAVGTPPEVIAEPFTIVLWGVTNESMTAWSKLKKIGDPDKVNEIEGFAGSPGVVEGIARVCRSVEDIGQLKEGEILVAPTTSPSWHRYFKNKGCCHRCGRDYVPCRHCLS